jgi:N-acetylmuramoyl-L-alanine amidase
MRKIDYIVIHCTATQPNTKKEAILSYWKNTLKWKSVGYHRLIDANGVIHELANTNKLQTELKVIIQNLYTLATLAVLMNQVDQKIQEL